jgi:hypothetical protein
LVEAAEEAQSALMHFAELLQAWNSPDDEHTRYQLTAVLDAVLGELFGDAPLAVVPVPGVGGDA